MRNGGSASMRGPDTRDLWPTGIASLLTAGAAPANAGSITYPDGGRSKADSSLSVGSVTEASVPSFCPAWGGSIPRTVSGLVWKGIDRRPLAEAAVEGPPDRHQRGVLIPQEPALPAQGRRIKHTIPGPRPSKPTADAAEVLAADLPASTADDMPVEMKGSEPSWRSRASRP